MALNEYDDLLAGGTPQKDDYDAIADEAVTETKQNLKQSMWAASEKDPDRQARVLELSKKTNLPPSIVEGNYEDLARKQDLASMENEYDSLIAETPRLAKFLEDPEKAAVAKDDIQGLAKVEQAAKSQSFGRDLADAFAYGAINSASGLFKLAKMNAEQQERDIQKYFGDDAKKSLFFQSSLNAKNKQRNDEIIKYLDSKAEQFKPKDISEDVIRSVGKGEYKTASRALSLQVASSMPQLAILLASRGYGLSLMAGTATGNKYDENLKAGIDPDTARLNAMATGTIEAGIESIGGIGGNPLKQTLKGVIKGVGPQATKEILKESVKMVAKNAGEEGLEEFATSVSQDVVDWSMDVNKDALDDIFIRGLNASLVGIGAGGAMTSVSVAPQAVIKNAQVRMSAEAVKEAYLEIGEAVEATKLKKRSPEIQAEFIESVVKDSPIQNVYVPVQDMETYFQNKGQSAVRAAQELGFLEKYNQAKEAGTDVEIPMSVWISKVAPTEHYSGLADDIKFNPAEYSVNQTKREAEAIREQMQKETEAEKTREQEKVAEQARVRESVKSQLVAAGYSPRDADRQAQLYSSFFGTMADKSGRKADELFQQYGLKIQAAQQQTAVDGQMVLNQDAPMAPPFYSKLVQMIEQKVGPTATTSQLQGMVKDLKPEERKWTGFDDFLKGKEKVTKQELLDFLRANSLQVEEVTRGGESAKVEIGARVYNVVGPGGEVVGTFLSEDAADVEAAQMSMDNKEDFSVNPDEWDGETTLEDINLDDDQQPTKFSKYVLPGGENYREILFRLPPAQEQFQFKPEYKDIKNYERSERRPFKQVPRAEILENEEWKKTEKKLVAKVRKEDSGMTPAKARDFIRSAMILPEINISGASDELLAEFKSAQDVYRKIQSPFPNEIVYKLRADDLQQNLLIYDTQDGDKPFRIGAQRSKESFATFEEAVGALEENIRAEKQGRSPNIFRSSHWDEDNVLAHTRLNDRVDADGKRVLFVEEIQSDWHQKGRDVGYQEGPREDLAALRDESERLSGQYDKQRDVVSNALAKVDNLGFSSDTKAIQAMRGESLEKIRDVFGLQQGDPDSDLLVAEFTKLSEIAAQIKELDARRERAAARVPDAPFRKTWHEFVLKRIIRMAAEQGYDRVAWTTGDQQAERYKNALLEKVDRFEIRRDSPNSYDLNAMYRGKSVTKEIGIPAERVSALVGKSLGTQLTEAADAADSDVAILEGGDFNVGGEGMRGFYDKILVDYAKKFGKKFGATVGDLKLPDPESRPRYSIEKNSSDGYAVYDRINDEYITQPNDTYNAIVELAKKLNATAGPTGPLVHSLPITPELKAEALNQGFSLFQQGDQGPRGQIQFGADRQFNISLFQSKDPSTFLHESAHFFLEVMGDLAGDANTSQDLKDDYQTILKYLKVESRDQIKTEQHEVFARTWEAYLMEGKAPSSKLRKAFATFKTWLVSVYRQVQNLDVQITPEIRSVMDRMLVAEDEAKRAQETMGYDPLFADPAAMGMNAKQQAAYIEAREEARLYAEDQIRQKLMQDHIRSEKQFYKEKRSEVEEEVLKELQQSREYKALYALQKNTMPDGSALPEGTPVLKISKSSLIAAVGAETAKTVPRGTSAKEGVHIEIVAEILGYGSGSQLVSALSNLPDIKAATEIKTNERMAELYPDSLNDPQISDRAVQAAHSDARAKVLRMELEYLATYVMPVLKDAIRRVARRVPTEKMVRDQAVKILAGQKISEIKPIIYQRAEIKAAKEAGQLLAKGDIDGAFESKRKELLNHELYRAAVEAKERVEKDVKNFKKLFKSDEDLAKTRDVDLVNAARSVLSLFGITRADKGPLEYLGQMRLYDNDRYLAVSAMIEASIENAGPYKEIKYDDFVAMSDSVMALWDLSKSSREIEVDGVKRDREQVMAEMSERLIELTKPENRDQLARTPNDWERAKLGLMGIKSSLRRVEGWVKGVDGTSKIFMKAMIQPIQDATTRYRLRKKTVVEQYLKIVEGTNTKGWTGSKIDAPEINFSFKDKSQIIGTLLHTGNASNLQKLLLGRGWGVMTEDGELDSSRWDQFLSRAHQTGLITKADWDFVQSIWDLNESLKPDAQKAHKKMYGFYFNEITADEVSTPFGSYRGGYMPAVADQTENQDAMIRAEKELLEKENNSFMFPTTGRGFTKSRVEAYAPKLSLDLGMVPAHIDKVLRFIEIEPTVKSLGRIVTDKGFRKVLDAYDPTAGGEMLMPWLQRVASQRVSNPSGTGRGWQAVDRFFTGMRSRAGLQAMTLNFTNTFQQFTGFTIAAVKVKPRYLRNALWTYVRSPKVTSTSIIERSEYMKSKLSVSAGEMLAHIEDLITNPSKYEKAVDFAKKNGYFLQSASQNMIDTVVWSAAYEQALENGMTEADAVKDADSVVRTTQGTLNPEDISRFETGSPFMRLFTQFYSFFNMQANLLGTEYQVTMRDLGLRKGAGRLVYVYTMGFMLPAVLSELIVQAMAGKGLDADDDDEYMDDFLKVFFGSQARSGAAMVPVAGQTMNVVVNNFNDKWYDDRISTSPSISMIESAAKAPSSVYLAIADNGDKDKAIKDSLTALGLITGLPLAPLGRPITYMGAVAEGRTEPTGPVDFARGLVTGKTGDR